MAPQSPS
ncbi:hypothetical protein E2C01_047318 [Portunus trituberculatus]|nr:hypothetical protein [Portunus trituberculatus]